MHGLFENKDGNKKEVHVFYYDKGKYPPCSLWMSGTEEDE